MKINIVSFAFLIAPSMMCAVTWDLDSCINYAIEHNITVKSRYAEKLSAEIDVTSAKNRFLPEASANASQSFNFGRGLTSENTYANRNTSNFQWGASLSVPLFQGLSATRQLSYANANLRTYIEQYEAAKDDVTVNVITAYLQVLYCKEIEQVATNQVEISTQELNRRNALLDAGKIAEVEVLEAKSQLAQDELSLTNAINDYTLAIVDLTQLLELNDATDFNIMPLEEENGKLLSAEEVFRNAMVNNHSILASRSQVNASEKNIKLAQSGYIPRLSFNAGIGSSYYNISGYANEPFSDQMKHNFNTYVGFTLSIPLFDAFSTRNSISKAKIQRLTAQLQYDNEENALYKVIKQAHVQAVGAEKKLSSSTLAEDAARKTFEAISEKYLLGRATSTEYEQAKLKYLSASSERVQAKYETILRKKILEFYNKE